MTRQIVVAFMLCIAIFFCHADVQAEKGGSSEQLFDIVGKGDMLVIPVPYEDVKEIGAALDSYRNGIRWPRGVNVVLLSVPGQQAAIVICGRDTERARQELQPLLDLLETKQLIAVTVNMRQFDLNSNQEIGLNILDPAYGIEGSFSRTIAGSVTNSANKIKTTTDAWSLQANNSTSQSYAMMQFQELWATGKTLIAGEVYTDNGAQAVMNNDFIYPVLTMNDYNAYTSYSIQSIPSMIKVTPSIVAYDAQDLKNSTVRLDVEANVSFITSIVKYKNLSSPEWTVKNITATRLIKADNEPVIAGSIVSNLTYRNRTGWPILKDIPVVKYLFSHNQTQKQKIATVLAVAVRIIPRDGKLSGGTLPGDERKNEKN